MDGENHGKPLIKKWDDLGGVLTSPYFRKPTNQPTNQPNPNQPLTNHNQHPQPTQPQKPKKNTMTRFARSFRTS